MPGCAPGIGAFGMETSANVRTADGRWHFPAHPASFAHSYPLIRIKFTLAYQMETTSRKASRSVIIQSYLCETGVGAFFVLLGARNVLAAAHAKVCRNLQGNVAGRFFACVQCLLVVSVFAVRVHEKAKNR